jgi:hypothetical protein
MDNNRLAELKKSLKDAQIDAAWAQQTHNIDEQFNALDRVKRIEEEIASLLETSSHE